MIAATLLSGNAAKATGKSEQSLIQFCNEPLPLHKARVVKNLEAAIVHTGSLPLLQIRPKALQFFRRIEPILSKYGIPLDFKYLCIIESSLESKATSPKGAHGFWQFMPETAKAMGLVVNEKVDERQNLAKSTQAACRYFLTLHRQLGSWTLVAAAYNAGPSKLMEYQALNRKRNYYDWVSNAETKQYLYRIVAAKELMTRPEIYTGVLREETSLRYFLGRHGLWMGLVQFPEATKRVKRKVVEAPTGEIELASTTYDEAILSGFVEFFPVAFRRLSVTEAGFDVAMAPAQIVEVLINLDNDLGERERLIQGHLVPFYARRRDELYMLPPRVFTSSDWKKLFSRRGTPVIQGVAA